MAIEERAEGPGSAYRFVSALRLRRTRGGTPGPRTSELCFDARDECATCGKPVVTPANECEQFFETRNFSHDAHDVDAMTKIEECGTIGALGVVNAIGHELTQCRERCA